MTAGVSEELMCSCLQPPFSHLQGLLHASLTAAVPCTLPANTASAWQLGNLQDQGQSAEFVWNMGGYTLLQQRTEKGRDELSASART
jgi:hypothetical protein